MTERESNPRRNRGPDETNPPTRLEDLWGGIPRRADAGQAGGIGFVPRRGAEALTGADLLSLYRSASDLLSVGAYAEATDLLRQLLLHGAAETRDESATPERARRLLAVAEALLGLEGERDHSSNA